MELAGDAASGDEGAVRMRILIADDEIVSRRILSSTLFEAGHEVIVAEDGAEAWDILQQEDAPRLAILDWEMPGLCGPDICRLIRKREDRAYTYTILVTARDGKEDTVLGLGAGADDYLTKPFHGKEFRSRVRVGERVLTLESTLAGRIAELKIALDHVRQLQGLLPVCMHCKRTRDQGDIWHELETYIQDQTGAVFSHGLCPECMKEHYPEIDGVEASSSSAAAAPKMGPAPVPGHS
jgi:CheY-like chemotaxis protein